MVDLTARGDMWKSSNNMRNSRGGGGSLAGKCATHPCPNTSEMEPKRRITAHQICTPKWRHQGSHIP